MWTYMSTPSPDEIYHHGILGMKWGVRRYQNKDGTLTAAGRKRYFKDVKSERNENIGGTRTYSQSVDRLSSHPGTQSLAKDENVRAASDDYKEKYEKFNKIVDKMSDYEDDAAAYSQNPKEYLQKLSSKEYKKLEAEHDAAEEALGVAYEKYGKSIADALSAETIGNTGHFLDRDLVMSAVSKAIANLEAKEKPFSSLTARKFELLSKAKNKDQYNLDFLEMCPENLLEVGGEKMIKEYEKFLTDPEAWMENRYSH